jgi:Leucine-rich repeat (LRR) protein
LGLGDNKLAHVETRHVPNVQYLVLGGNPMEHFSAAQFPNVVELRIESNCINHLNLSDMPFLSTVFATKGQIQSLTMRNLPRFTQGRFHGNGITAVECADCPHLSSLDLICNFLTNLDFVRDVPSLEHIWLVGNPHIPIPKEALVEENGRTWRNCIGEVREYLAGSEV